MKKILLCCLLLAPATLVFAQKDSLECFLEQANFFKLRQALRADHRLDKDTRLYYQCFVDNAFNMNEVSIRNVDLFLKKKPHGFSDTAIARLLAMQAYNYADIYQYSKAAAV